MRQSSLRAGLVGIRQPTQDFRFDEIEHSILWSASH